MTKLDELKRLLEDAGFTYEVSGYESNYTVSVEVPVEDVELPEELRPYAWTMDQVDRAIWKGNTEKRTFAGAEFELALREYAQHLMFTDPEAIELEKTLKDVFDIPSLDAYQAKRKAIWKRICARPEIVEWEATLDTLL